MKSFKRYIEERMAQVNSGFVISRQDMPQIDDVEDFLIYLDSCRFEWELDQNVEIEHVRPTQVHFDTNKVAGMEPSDKPIILSEEWFILDGHHRYYANLINSDKKFISAYIVKTTINQLLKLAKDYLEK